LFRFWEEFLGKGAISLKKSLTPAKICVILGWVTNLEMGGIHMNERSAGKIFFVFFAVDPEVAQPSGVWSLLAALASRYSAGIPVLRAFVRPFWTMTGSSEKNRKVRIKASSEARFGIEIWRSVALLLIKNPAALAIPIESVIPRWTPSEWYGIIISDASPTDLCVALYSCNKTLRAWMKLVFPWEE
jgi:hypothetical protein